MVGLFIILAAYLPILALVGIEGKMFRPMGATVIMALVGALIMSITLIPALCALFLKAEKERENPALRRVSRWYEPSLIWAMKRRVLMSGGALTWASAPGLAPNSADCASQPCTYRR